MRYFVLVFALALCACAASDNQRPRATNTITVYQPSLGGGMPGRVVRIKQKTDASFCGPISPSYQYIYGIDHQVDLPRHPGIDSTGGIEFDFSVWDVPPPDSLSYDEKIRRRPSSAGLNLIAAEKLVDPSWMLWEIHFSRDAGNQDFSYKHFSVDEAECWAKRGDQIAQYMMRLEYLPQGREAVGQEQEFYTKRAVQFLQMAATPPETVDSCETVPAPCSANLLKPFPAGLGQANYYLHRNVRYYTEFTESLGLKDAAFYLKQAVRGAHGRAYSIYYDVPLRGSRY